MKGRNGDASLDETDDDPRSKRAKNKTSLSSWALKPLKINYLIY